MLRFSRLLNYPELARGAFISLLVRGGGLGLGYVTQVFLARWLGETGFGTYSLVLAWATTLGVVAALGWPDTIVRFLPISGANDRSGLVRFSVASAAAAGTLIAAVGLTLRPDVEPLHGAFGVGLWMIPLIAVGHLLSAWARTDGRAVLALAPNSILRPAVTLLVVGLISVQFQPTGTQAVAAAALAVLLGVGWQSSSQRIMADGPQFQSRRWLRVAMPIWLFSVLGLATEKADLLIIGAYLPIEEVAAYGAATATASVVLLFLLAAEVLAGPRFAAAETDELQGLVRETTRLGFWPAVVLTLVFVVFGDQVLGLFGEAFRRAHVPLVILSIGRVISAGAGSVVLVLNVTGHQDDTLKAFAVIAPLSVLASLIVVPRFGITGAAAVTATTLAAWNIWLHAVVRRRLNISTFPYG